MLGLLIEVACILIGTGILMSILDDINKWW
jgi:hypothetical protein